MQPINDKRPTAKNVGLNPMNWTEAAPITAAKAVQMPVVVE